MENKIIIALRRHYHCEHARLVLQQNNLSYPVYEINESDIAYKQLSSQLRNSRILITGDVYAEQLMQQLNISVVTIRRSKIPFTESIREALRLADRAAIVWRENDSLAAQNACLEFGSSVSFYPYQKQDADINTLLQDLKSKGFRVIIGAGTLNPYAERHGMTVVNIPYDEADILNAVRIAEHNLQALEERQQYIETLKSIQDNISEGIITLYPDGRIQTVNRSAVQILQLSSHVLIDEPLDRTPLACSETDSLLSLREPFSNKILTIKGSSIAMDGRPILTNHIMKSAILTLTQVEQLQRNEQLIRAQMNAGEGVASISFHDIIGQSKPLLSAIRTAHQYASVDSSVLIYGESGTGKEMFVQSIHNASARRKAPFVVINCAALPESLIESELFGYEKGAFTGALSSGKQGLFERGHKGTVFLDEISEMPLHVQARFLRVLQEREVSPIGSQRVIPVDIRIIAATNRDLIEMVQKKQFREDLYYRISVLTMELPPLRQRDNDMDLLVRHFIHAKNQSLMLHIKEIRQEAIDYLKTLSYPGNIRQLSNIVERAMVLSGKDVFNLEAVVNATSSQSFHFDSPESDSSTLALNNLRAETIRRALAKNNNSRSLTANELGISTSTLYRRMKELAIRI